MSMAIAAMSAAELPFTVTPEPGSTLEVLDVVTLELKEGLGYDYMDLSSYGISLRKNGEVYCALNANQKVSEYTKYTLTPEFPVTESGNYDIVIDQYALECGGDLNYYFNDEDLVFSYTVGNGGSETPADVPFYVLEPAPGEVNQLQYILLQLSEESGFDEFIINNDEGLYFTKDGEPYCPAMANPSGTILEVYPDGYIVSTGEYALVIEEGAISWVNTQTQEKGTLSQKVEFVYTIDAGEQELAFTVYPEPDSVVESLTEVVLTADLEKGFYAIFMEDAYCASFKHNGEFFCAVEMEEADDYSYLTLRPAEPITEPGVYELVIQAASLFCGSDWDYYMNFEDLVFSYTVGTLAEVEYDVIPSYYKPADGSEIDFSMRDFASVTMTVEEGIMPAEWATAWIIPVDAPDDAVEAKIEKVRSMNQLIINFDPMQYNGKYEVYIPEGSFGDEAWIANPQTGHTNPEISLYYILYNANDRESNVAYTLVPEITVSDDYASFTLTFEEGVFMGDFAYATYSNEEARYSKYAEFTESGNSTFTVTFDEAPSAPGNYTFMVVRGMFGDAEFIESHEESGVANEAITMVVEVNTTGISSVSVESVKKGVYNLHGVKVADSTDNLPAGLYIVGGKKMVVK